MDCLNNEIRPFWAVYGLRLHLSTGVFMDTPVLFVLLTIWLPEAMAIYQMDCRACDGLMVSGALHAKSKHRSASRRITVKT
jgi:hypothetical protein